MEKQSTTGRKPPVAPPKKLAKDRVLQVSEDEASRLLGGIVEKGMADNHPTPPSSAPRPSALPFPVARHRSHGPHWSPNVSQFGDGLDDDNEDDTDPTDYHPIADFAKTIQKKNKKGLDFSKWREFGPSNNNVSSIHGSNKINSVKTGVEKQNFNQEAVKIIDQETMGNEPSTEIDVNNDFASYLCGALSMPAMAVDTITEPIKSVAMGVDRSNESSLSESNKSEALLDNASGRLESNSIGYRGGEMSMESQIDAENRALLQKMSPEEIAEAQTEIRNRINPELLKILKKRGLQKSEKQKNSLVDAEADKLVTKGEKELFVPESPSLKDAEKSSDDGVTTSLISKSGSLWDAWSKRVEGVRILRFSLDGNVIEGSSLGQTFNADNVGQRDYLRTEGDPGAAGYTIKEALALVRSIIPGQRALALHLLASVLSKALHNICKSQLDCTMRVSNEKSVDWEAIWAYALGPEPELVLSMRMALDDNHNSVVLASAKVIQCVLACDVNDKFFNRLEKIPSKDLHTAPIFRSRPDIKDGFLGGGFWKFSTKPSNIIPPDEEILNDKGEERTIQDDNIIAGQDVAAGLVRMGFLPRVRYILEIDPSMALEECILSILVAIARHSPKCANAIWKCERLVQTIIDRFTMKDTLEFQASKIKSVTLLRVLAQSSNSICTEIIKKGYFQSMTWQLYRVTSSVDEWVKCGRENCKRTSELMVEQLRFWKVCIMYGQCISYFSAFFPALCLWLNPPTFDKLIETNVFDEFAAISEEVYLILETLARRLPDLYSPVNTHHHQVSHSYGDNLESWCWSDVGPMVNTALKWIELLSDSALSKFLQHNTYESSFLWIMSAVTHMLHTVLVKATPEDELDPKGGSKSGPMVLDFVTNLALQIIKGGVLNFSDRIKDGHATEQCQMGFFIEKLCYFRHQSNLEASLASVRCLHGLFRVIVSIDCLILLIGNNARHTRFQGYELYSRILEDGILKCSLTQWKRVISEFMKLVNSEWHFMPNIEVFGRGGPAPGVGVGWGALGGGFWSLTVSLAQADATFLSEMLKIFHCSPTLDLPVVAEETFITNSINSVMAMTLMVGPGDEVTIQKALDVLLQIPVLTYLDQCISHFLHCFYAREVKRVYEESDLIQFSKILSSHFRIRWLSPKKKKKKPDTNRTVRKGGNFLDTIHEDVETSPVTIEDNNSLTIEWAHQRLPLPSHWFLSPITTVNDVTPMSVPIEYSEVAKAGIFFLLGVEAMSSKLPGEENSPVGSIPLIWKLHSLSVALLPGMGVLDEERSRGVFEALQSLYGQQLDKLPFTTPTLKFQSEIHENYTTFIETLIEQFAAVSYGDLAYGKQITFYLHKKTEDSVRLAAWNALSNARVLELLPPLGNCLSDPKGYLEPVEGNDVLLEAYVKSWVSGSLDRAAKRDSVTYTIVLHHLSSFVFENDCGERLLLRNKLMKSLLRDYSRKQQRDAMMLDFIRYNYYSLTPLVQRFEVLKEACEGNSQLLTVVEKLRSSVLKEQS